MKKICWKKVAGCLVFLAGIIFPALLPLTAGADEYKFMGPGDLKVRLEMHEPMILVDIQEKNAYLEHHFYGSISTRAFPVRTESDTQGLAEAVQLYKQTRHVIVIIGPRGGGASQRAQDFLISRGIPGEDIHILEGGIREWPYREMLLNLQGGCG
ncbi:MAG: rhodanese-like domain-containing protein [Desulfobulbaceae bacterium]|nr:rhodanese-like domain-containing protein [Desulfobulbaceae bacterium]